MRHAVWDTVRHTLGSYRRLLGAALRSQLQYRASFAFDLLDVYVAASLHA